MRLAAVLLLLACAAPGEPPPDECPCAQVADARTGGAVVVRWRVQDARVGRLFARSQCCCAPEELDPASEAARQCPDSGSRCPDAPAWLIEQVRLRVVPLGPGAGVGGRTGPCFISAPCIDAELTTDFCLAAGEYELQLVAPVARLWQPGGASLARFVFDGLQARSPPAMRRRVVPGHIVNLDAIVLGVNEP
ncbi:MAG: hypothetical protein RMK29_10485 [Myxococcales bacterium]|nr:hypothetical protein [Myxococcota bacterium]MDW8282130.1 hypothetical protein [Myxococcales bacterium]